MNKRNIKYGYCIQNGKIMINEAEACIIREIFAERHSGKGVQTIGKELFESNTDYFSDSQAKAVKKVSAILYSSVYIGEKGFPAVVERSVFEAVGKTKGKRSKKAHVCKVYMLADPSEAEFVYNESEEIISAETEINRLLDLDGADTKKLREMIMKLAAEKYAAVGEQDITL